jgi:HK97 family phage portal protein
MIVSTKHGNVAVESRAASLGALIESQGGTPRSSSGVPASAREIAGLPGFQQAIRIAGTSLAKHELGVWRGEAGERRRITSTWQGRFFRDPPNELYPWFFVWEGTEASLTARNNAYWLKIYDQGRVAAVYLVHPDNINPRWNPNLRRAEYKVRLDTGEWSDWLTQADILHFRAGAPDPGAVLAPSPLELHRRTWQSALAKTRSESDFYDRGLMKAVAVVFPDQVTPEQAARWKDVYLGPGGIESGSQVKVFGGNPKIETIGLSQQDAQYVESQAFTLEDIGRILGVPPSLLWAASKEGAKPITPEHEEDRWFRYGLEPRRIRIESWIRADPAFFGPGARDYPMFSMDVVRGDLRTESETLVREVQAGIILVDEARAKRGMPPLPDGIGKIPQIVPVGGAPNPVPVEPQGDSEDDE